MTTQSNSSTSTSSTNKNYYKLSKTDTHQIAGLYDLEETIGQGHFAVVKLARHIFTGEKVAIKVIDKTKLDQISREHLFQEVRCMKLVQHPNVVRLYEVIDTTTKLYLILELGDGGDMYDYIMKHTNGLSEIKACNYFKQILRAIKYCHDLHVVHRDLKPENVVFFERTGEVKLTDFGFSNVFIPGKKLSTSCGSLAYSAPEILLGDSYDAPAVDVWSLGVILYMLVTGHAPFQEANDSETLTMILDCKYYLPAELSSECKNLISRMLVREPENRIQLDEIAKHEWLLMNNDDQDSNNSDNLNNIPLIKRETLTEQERSEIINNMVKGNIATYDEIIRALKADDYNYITATFYLLAERLLRRYSSSNQGYANLKSRNQPSKGSLNKNQSQQQQQAQQQQNNQSQQPPPSQQQQQPLKQQTKSNTNKRKFNNLVISEVDVNEEEEEVDENENRNKKFENEPNNSPKNKIKNELDKVDDDVDFETIDDNTLTNSIQSNSTSNRRVGRELIAFAIPEEAEETNLIELNKENNDSNLNKQQSVKQIHIHSTSYSLKEISEEAESDQDGDIDEDLIELNKNDKSKSSKNELTKLTATRARKKPSLSTSSTDDDGDGETITNDELNNKYQSAFKQPKKSSQKKNQPRIRPLSISDMSGNEEQTANNKVTMRAKSVESTDVSPLKHSLTTSITITGNDLAPPLNYNLKSLSIEHRLANISQMSISSQLSKTNSIRHNSRSGACDTPIQHIHSSTPTPRESIVFNRGDEKPIAKILLQQQQLNKQTSTQQQPPQQQQQREKQLLQQQISTNGTVLQIEKGQKQNNHQQKIQASITNDKRNNSETSTISNNQLNGGNSRTASLHSYDTNDSESSEYENTTLKSNKTLIKNTKVKNLNDSYNNAITTSTTTQTQTLSYNTNKINNNNNNSVNNKNNSENHEVSAHSVNNNNNNNTKNSTKHQKSTTNSNKSNHKCCSII